MLTNKLKFTWSILLILGVFLTSCNLIDSIKELINPDDGNTTTNQPVARTDLEEKLYSAGLVQLTYEINDYCVEDGNDPFFVYDRFDFDPYYGIYDSVHASFSSDGLNYTLYSNGSEEGNFILNELQIDIEFSDDHLSINHLHLYDNYDELYFTSESTRKLEYEITIDDPIKILTTNSDSIEMMNGITYTAEMVDSSNYDLFMQEIYPGYTPEVKWTYYDTEGQNRYLHIKVFFHTNN